MALTAAAGLVAGGRYHWITKVDSAGYPVGQATDPETVANGTESAAYLSPVGHVSLETPAPARLLAQGRSGGKLYAQLDLGAADLGSFSFEMGAYDEAYHALVTGVANDTTTFDNVLMRGLPLTEAVPPTVMGAWASLIKLTSGSTQWLTRIFHACQITPGVPPTNQSDGVNPIPNSATVIPSEASRSFLGTALGSTSAIRWGVTLRTLYPVHMHTFRGDNSDTTVTLPYLPIYSTATGAADNFISINGVATAVTSVNTSTGVVTFAAAPAAGAKVVIVYQTNFATA